MLATMVLAGLLALGAPWDRAAAQSPLDYQRLFGIDQGSSGSASQPLEQSRPPSGFDPTTSPGPADYGALVTGAAEAPRLDSLLSSVSRFHGRLVATLLRAPDAFSEVLTTLEAASPTGRPSYFVGVAIFSMMLLAVGRAFSQLFAVYVARPVFVGLQRANPQGYAEKLPVLAFRVLLTIVGTTLAVGLASGIGLVYYDGHQATLSTALIIFGAYGAALTIDTIWRMALCPYLPAYRIPRLSERDARRLYLWLLFASVFGVVAIAFCLWIRALGLSREVFVLMSIGLGGLTVLGLILMIRANAPAITGIIRAGRPPEALSWLTVASMRLWAPVGIVYLVAAWGRMSYDLVTGMPAGPQTLFVPYVVLLGGILVYVGTSYLIERVFRRTREVAVLNAEARALRERESEARSAAVMEEARTESFGASGSSDDDGSGDGDDESASAITALEERRMRLLRPGRSMQSFEDLARRVASLFALGASVWILFYSWGGSQLFAENRFLGIAEDLIDIIFIGYIAFHAVRIWMDQKIAEEVGEEDPTAAILDGEGGGAGATRLATLLPLVRNFILGIMLIAVTLAVASEIGVNVGPLFAGAGIVGLAIGFGSQTLVRDILSGAFFLMDDAFRKGEYIDVGSVKGTVEKISLRSFQLRHHLGMLHTIPFGEIAHLTNFSRDWVMMKLPLRLTYDTDVERVRKLVKKLGQELLEDPIIGDKFLQPLKSQGVIEMEDSAMIVRVKFMTKPGEQWVIRKRVYQEIRDLFEREGVKFAHREVTVRLPDLPHDRPLSAEEQRAVGAAGRTAVDVAESGRLAALAPAGGAGPVDDR